MKAWRPGQTRSCRQKAAPRVYSATMNLSAPGPETRVYGPAELNQEVRIHLEAGFPRLWVRGEISNLARPASGHLYFTVKDSRAQIRCALFRGNAAGLAFRPQNGDAVLVRGRLSLYEPRGDYQLIADGLLAAGAGELQAAFEALKKKLSGEGLFAPDRKKPLPAWPTRIAVVTSPSGAAIRDILQVLGQRWPLARVRVYPAQVQGAQAPGEIIRALRAADRDDFAEVILLARGGGSLEDLWAFNDEELVRLITRLDTPVVTGVGHETDFTIADFVADLRAPTPSAAAAAATPDGPALQRRIKTLLTSLERAARARLERHAQGLDYLERRLAGLHPGRRLREIGDRKVLLDKALQRTIDRRLGQAGDQLQRLRQRLLGASPAKRLDDRSERLGALARRLDLAADHQLERSHARLAEQARALDNVSPLKVLERGYAVVRDRQGRTLTQPQQFSPGQDVNLQFRRFAVGARITEAAADREPD
ncbi:MAG: exodeoxyribonuclease VII large subunit [Wenzhouxiangella sp.]|nr:MAG: exodeoxyribonuclease VII large subunit [Wenzhouxiangella sp.]